MSLSATPASCLFVVEMEYRDGDRWWSQPMDESLVNAYIEARIQWAGLSDIDHTGECVGNCSTPRNS